MTAVALRHDNSTKHHKDVAVELWLDITTTRGVVVNFGPSLLYKTIITRASTTMEHIVVLPHICLHGTFSRKDVAL